MLVGAKVLGGGCRWEGMDKPFVIERCIHGMATSLTCGDCTNEARWEEEDRLAELEEAP
jgi:hypothetical protein